MPRKINNFGEICGSCFVFTLFLLINGALLNLSVRALERDRTIAQFFHTAWTAKDGAPSQISALAQTADGYLWIGSARGLFRFDGIQFEAYVPDDGKQLPSHNIYAVASTRDGGLWVSFRPSGLGFLKNGEISVFTEPDRIPRSQVYCFAEDSDGRVWAGTHTGLAFFDGSRWIEVGEDRSFKPERVRTMFVDRAGTLWVATDTTIVFLPRGARAFEQTGVRVGMVTRMAQAPDGRIWLSELGRYAHPIDFARQASNQEPEQKITGDVNDVLFDRDGSLWLTSSDGVRRVQFPERLPNAQVSPGDPMVESYDERDGLSDNPVHNLFEDREGNIWVTSVKGLDRFRYSRFVPVELPPGHSYSTLLAGANGEIQAANAVEKDMVLVRGGKVVQLKTPMEISSVYRDRASGDVWWGGVGGIWRVRENGTDFFPQPKKEASVPDFVWEIIRGGDDGSLWVGLGDIGLTHFKDGVWGGRDLPAGLIARVPSASFQDPSGRIWFGYTENRVSVIDAGRVQAYTQADGLDIGRIRVVRGRRSRIWLGGETGLAFFDQGKFRQIKTTGGESFGTVTGIIETSDGALWLNELRGVIRIAADEIEKAVDAPDHAVAYQLFDFLDGLPGGAQMNYTVSTAVEGTDGRLWFATDNGLAWIDPARISKNGSPPPVAIRALQTNNKSHDLRAEVELEAGTQSLRIDYTALSLSIPERVLFKYKLEGADENWEEAGTRRTAFYNNLRPGAYTFRVIACNNDGVWNESGATLNFRIAPMFYQTSWFLAICLAAAGFLFWVGHRWRFYLLKARLQGQFEDRLQERTRIAQELHDTLLQGVFSTSILLDSAVEQLADDSPVKPRLARVQQLSEQILVEGRNTIRGLHSPNADSALAIEKAFDKIKQDLDTRAKIDFRIVVGGDVRTLHPIVRDEIYRLGREAVINAFRHSKAEHLAVEIEYGAKYFKLSIGDDGIGIAPEILRSGRDGHLGLSGMRDCAAKIGAKLKISSRPENGTRIELLVPQHIAYGRTEKTFFGGILDRLKIRLGHRQPNNLRNENRKNENGSNHQNLMR